MNKDVLYNTESNDSLYIFCDASVYKFRTYDYNCNIVDKFISCAGAIAVSNRRILNETYRIVTDASNMRGEIEAIKDGVYLALSSARLNPRFKNFYIFSDSEVSILGIRSRIFGWRCLGPDRLYQYDMEKIYCGDTVYNPIYLNGSSGFISNQSTYLEIINTMVENNFKVGFYHQKGHVRNNRDSIFNAKKVFERGNAFNDVDVEFIRYISGYNDMVDIKTGEVLSDALHAHRLMYTQPVHFIITDKEEYREKINKYNSIRKGE